MEKICTVQDFGMTDYNELMPKIIRAKGFEGIDVTANMLQSTENKGMVVRGIKLIGNEDRIDAFIEHIKSL